MAGGLVALLDDVAALTRLAAASLDDVAGAAGRAGAKAAGVVIDDTAVTPNYVMKLAPERELPIIGKIALGSLVNKLVILLPAALLLSSFAPWAITPLLMAGGTYLCFEGAEKVWEAVSGHGHAADEDDAGKDAAAIEKARVWGAIRTDLILSAEIMAIALAEVGGSPLGQRAIILALVGVALTAGVYGAVAVIVKMDDIGVHLAKRGPAPVRGFGRGLVRAMPVVMTALSVIGTAAMIWVGGGIVLHGLEGLGIAAPAEAVHALAHGAGAAVPAVEGVVAWIVQAACAGVVGLVLGGIVAAVVSRFHRD